MRVRRRIRKPTFKGDRAALRYIYSGHGDYEENEDGYHLAQKVKDEFGATEWIKVDAATPAITISPPSIEGAWGADIYLLSKIPVGKGGGTRTALHWRSAPSPENLFKKIQELLRISCNYVELPPERERRSATGRPGGKNRKRRG